MKLRTLHLLAAILLIAGTDLAQDGGSTQRVEFQNGKTSTRAKRAVDLMNPDAWVLRAHAGQRLKVQLKGNGVLIRLLAPSNRIEVADSQRIDQLVPETGDYKIIVHCYASKSLRYRLDIQLR